MTERWQEIERIYQQALELDKAARATVLTQECAGDPALRAEVEIPAGADEQQAGSFFRRLL